jgi:hypothetical protein
MGNESDRLAWADGIVELFGDRVGREGSSMGRGDGTG